MMYCSEIRIARRHTISSAYSKRLARVFFAVLFLTVGERATDLYGAEPQRVPSERKIGQAPPWLKGFDDHVEKVMREWHIPGAAIGVLRDGKIVHIKAYGLRDTLGQLPVTTDTIFPIGSITKSFTATGLGMLADEGKLDWAKPVQHYLPEFRLHDEMASARANVVDLLTHRTGVPGQEGMISCLGTREWLDKNVSRRDIMRSLVHIEPTSGFRAAYEYNNEMYAAAGLLFEALDNKTWEEFTQSRILDRLGMSSTYLHVRDVPASLDVAQGHYYVHLEDRLERAGIHESRAIGPAGTIASSVPDMLKWVLFHINRGRHEQQQLLSLDAADRLILPHVPLPDTNPRNHVGGFYGMGFMVFAESGRKKWVQHAGSISNCVSLVGFVPARRDGFVILTNWTDGLGYVPLQAIAADLSNRFFGRDRKDIIKNFRKVDDAQWEQVRSVRESVRIQRQAGTKPSHKLPLYAGVYESRIYRSVEVSQLEGRLELSFHGTVGRLKHHHYDVFSTKIEHAIYHVTFLYNRKNGLIDRMLINMGPGADEVEFVRAATDASTESTPIAPEADPSLPSVKPSCR